MSRGSTVGFPPAFRMKRGLSIDKVNIDIIKLVHAVKRHCNSHAQQMRGAAKERIAMTKRNALFIVGSLAFRLSGLRGAFRIEEADDCCVRCARPVLRAASQEQRAIVRSVAPISRRLPFTRSEITRAASMQPASGRPAGQQGVAVSIPGHRDAISASSRQNRASADSTCANIGGCVDCPALRDPRSQRGCRRFGDAGGRRPTTMAGPSSCIGRLTLSRTMQPPFWACNRSHPQL